MKINMKSVFSLLLIVALFGTIAACSIAPTPKRDNSEEPETAPVTPVTPVTLESYDLSGWFGVFSNNAGSVTITAPQNTGSELTYTVQTDNASGGGEAHLISPTEASGIRLHFVLSGDELWVEHDAASDTKSISGTYIREKTQEDSSLGGMTEARAWEIRAIMSPFFDKYDEMDVAGWVALPPSEKSAAYATYSEMIEQLGFTAWVSESEWIADIDAEGDFYSLFFAASSSMLNSKDRMQLSYDTLVYHYIEGVEAGKFRALHPDILAAADSLIIENWKGQYLLCTGSDHVVCQATREWTTLDTIFMESGSVFPEGPDGRSISYSLGGSDGKMRYADVGNTDLIPVFKAMGAIADDGAMAHEQIQISARSTFDAPTLYVMSEESADVIRIALVRYNPLEARYVWDGEILTASGRCCFDASGAFCFVDESGNIRSIDGIVTTAETASDSDQASGKPDPANAGSPTTYTLTAEDAAP